MLLLSLSLSYPSLLCGLSIAVLFFLKILLIFFQKCIFEIQAFRHTFTHTYILMYVHYLHAYVRTYTHTYLHKNMFWCTLAREKILNCIRWFYFNFLSSVSSKGSEPNFRYSTNLIKMEFSKQNFIIHRIKSLSQVTENSSNMHYLLVWRQHLHLISVS
jgi:hypothetical protein